MESPLEVLSRAATMVQDNANDTRLTTKELPTTKWRRDRRLRATEYQHSLSSPTVTASPPTSPQLQQQHMLMQQNSIKPLGESTNRPAMNMIESPIDMSVTSTTMKPRSPPPPYREPLPGSTFATSLARPSVITQAPPKRGDSLSRDSQLISNRETDNRSTDSISMCETVIDEHFRRSLGPDYVALFGKKSPAPSTPSPTPTPTPSPVPSTHSASAVTAVPSPKQAQSPPKMAASPPHTPTTPPTPPPSRTVTLTNSDSSSSLPPSVDDHFAKALGDTWRKLQADKGN